MRSTAAEQRRKGGRLARGVQGQRARTRGRTLGIESLEGRRVLAANYIYGIDDNNNIWEINTSTQSPKEVYTNGTIPGPFSNAFAYDSARDQFFFIDGNNDLEFWSRTGNPATIVPHGELGLASPATTENQPQNAVYYNDAYWFFDEGTNVLNKVPFVYVGGNPTYVNGSRVTYPITDAPTTTNKFGDIAVNASGILYAATQNGQLYTVDISGSTPSAATTIVASGNPSFQLSFSYDYNTLYGQTFGATTYESENYPAGQWWTIDTQTGVPTPIDGFDITYGDTGNGLRDLGGAANDPAPSLDIKKDDGIQTVIAGDGVIHTYTITVSNMGQAAASPVTVKDTWPKGFVQIKDSFVTNPAGLGTIDKSTDDFSWEIPTLASGETVTLQVSYTVPFGAAVEENTTQFPNKVSASTPTDLGPHEATDTNTVVTNALVAGTDLGCLSAPFVYVINPYSGTPAEAGKNVGVSNEVYKRFNAYPEFPGFRGGVRVAVGDIDKDGIPDVVTAPGPGAAGKVKVFNLDGTPKAGFTPYFPFGQAYRDGIEINVGDIDGDGDDDLVAAKSRGPGEVQVAKSSATAFTAFKSFTAFGGTYRGGATAAIGSYNPDTNIAALVVGSGPGMPPTVKKYGLNATSGALTSAGQFAPAVPATSAGVSVTTQRFTGDLLDTLVAAGRNGNSRVAAYQAVNNAIIPGRSYSTFSAPVPKNNTPVYAAASSLAVVGGVVDTVFMAQGDGGVGTIKKVPAAGGNANQAFAPVYLGKPIVSPLRIATNTLRPIANQQ